MVASLLAAAVALAHGLLAVFIVVGAPLAARRRITPAPARRPLS